MSREMDRLIKEIESAMTIGQNVQAWSKDDRLSLLNMRLGAIMVAAKRVREKEKEAINDEAAVAKME